MLITLKKEENSEKTYFIEVVILRDELFQLALNVRDFITGKFELLQRHSCLL